MDLSVVTLAEQPDLRTCLDAFPSAWPPFLYHDPVTVALYPTLITAHPHLCLVALDPAEPGRPVARAVAVEVGWSLDRLPDTGYDAALLDSAALTLSGQPATMACAVEIVVRPDLRGRGVSHRMVAALRQAVARRGLRDLVAPVRPNHKHLHPDVPLADYLTWTRADGLPTDPWLRVHVRAGGRVIGPAPRSMVIMGSLARWREWTGLPFDVPGEIPVPHALTRVSCDTARDTAIYVEPNVWVHHRLDPQATAT